MGSYKTKKKSASGGPFIKIIFSHLLLQLWYNSNGNSQCNQSWQSAKHHGKQPQKISFLWVGYGF